MIQRFADWLNENEDLEWDNLQVCSPFEEMKPKENDILKKVFPVSSDGKVQCIMIFADVSNSEVSDCAKKVEMEKGEKLGTYSFDESPHGYYHENNFYTTGVKDCVLGIINSRGLMFYTNLEAVEKLVSMKVLSEEVLPMILEYTENGEEYAESLGTTRSEIEQAIHRHRGAIAGKKYSV